jgi:hypothetical protein
MLDDPVSECLLEADVATRLLGFQPFVPQDFFALSKEFPIQRGSLEQIFVGIGSLGRIRHGKYRAWLDEQNLVSPRRMTTFIFHPPKE